MTVVALKTNERFGTPMQKRFFFILLIVATVSLLFGASLLTVYAVQADRSAGADDLVYLAKDCVVKEETNPASAIMEQDFNGTSFSRFDATAVGQYITYALEVPEAGEYKVSIQARIHDSCGIADLYINGEKHSEFDNASGTANALKTFSLGKLTLKKGTNTFKFVITKPNPKPSGNRMFYLNIMRIFLINLFLLILLAITLRARNFLKKSLIILLKVTQNKIQI